MREFVAKVDDMTRLAAGKIVSARNVRDRFMLFFFCRLSHCNSARNSARAELPRTDSFERHLMMAELVD